MWQSIQVIINYWITSPASGKDDSIYLPDAQDEFYTWFEMQNNMAARKTIRTYQVLCLITAARKTHRCRVTP